MPGDYEKGYVTMFEMLLTVIVTVAAFIYGISNSVLVDSPYRHYYWAGIAIFIALVIIINVVVRLLRRSHLKRLHVNEYEYVYYHKYNSLLYRAGYFISYLIQNIMFDYSYMKRNFNFCKGLNAYDDGVSEYYIKFRNTWYRYLKLVHMRHRLSMNKLKAFSCSMKNRLIMDALESDEEKMLYRTFDKKILEYVEENGTIDNATIQRIEGADKLDSYYLKNTKKYWKHSQRADKLHPKIKLLVDTQEYHGKQDVDDYKKSRLR